MLPLEQVSKRFVVSIIFHMVLYLLPFRENLKNVKMD